MRAPRKNEEVLRNVVRLVRPPLQLLWLRSDNPVCRGAVVAVVVTGKQPETPWNRCNASNEPSLPVLVPPATTVMKAMK